MMLPSVAVADVQADGVAGGTVTIWTGAQGPFTTRDRVSDMLGLPKRNVIVNWVEHSGCYGRLTSDERRKTRCCSRAPAANRCACSGAARTNSSGSRRARSN